MEEHPHEAEDQSRLLRGVITRVTYQNRENGYSVLQLKVATQSDPVTVVGTFQNARIGAHVAVKGEFKDHPKFGRQLQAFTITEVAPTTSDGIEAYLASGLIKGIGEKTAQRIVREFGERTIEIISQDPDKVAKLRGVGKKKAQLIHETFLAQRETQEILQFLVERGITPHMAQKIFNQYKGRTVEIISRDPYLLARQIRGIGFLTADEIALNLGFEPSSPQRLKAGLYYALERAADDGHCFLPESELARRARALLGLEQAHDLQPFVRALIEEGFVIGQDERYYLTHLYKAEEFVAKFIASRARQEPRPAGISTATIESSLREAASSLGVTFSVEQEDAVRRAASLPLLIITGGPGCGKTTIIKALSVMFLRAQKRLALTAPTGRAAQRMSQICLHPSGTIHRLLRFDPRSGSFVHGINDPLPIDAIIVDEASMVDLMLAKDLFSAIPHEATLILVGDKDQLPSVGPGKVFADLIASKDVPIVALHRLFRRSEESRINDIAHMINSGIVPDIPEPDGQTKSDAYFIAKRDSEDAVQLIERLVSDQIPKKFDIPSADITVLTPSNRGPLGTLELNKRLQARVNPPGFLDEEQELELQDFTLRVGDRVCQRVNNYQIDPYGVFNGDTGTIHSIDRGKRRVTVELWDGRLINYESTDLHQLSLAYAVTVHRSQGSEMPCVVFALSDSHYTLLERQLIYTGVTRAKKLLVVVGSKRALAIASKRTSTRQRCTALQEKIARLLS